ncbi:MAG: hypothetical protein ABEJ99_01380 [Candidatus Nanohaloarchaea archaeon]
MVKINKLAAAIIAVGILIGASPFILNQTLLKTDTLTYPTSATVTKTNGTTNLSKLQFGVNTSRSLHFGQIPQGTRITKSLNFDAHNNTADVEITIDGNISRNIEFEGDRMFVGRTSLDFKFNGTEPGYYDGTVNLKISQPTGKLGLKWLQIRSRLF